MKDKLDVTAAAKVMSKLGASKGGVDRANVLTSEEKKEIARNAVNTRWAKVRRVKDSTLPTEQVESLRNAENKPQDERPDSLHIRPEDRTRVSLFKGNVQFGNIIVQCHVLDDGRLSACGHSGRRRRTASLGGAHELSHGPRLFARR